MADIFVSYTSQDRDWADWIGQQLEELGHTAHLDHWEIPGGGNIAAWMEERLDKADHILCVISEIYLGMPYASWERRAAQWAAQTDSPNFALPVRIEDCKLSRLLAPIKRCDLFGTGESEARNRLIEFLKPAAKPTGPVSFPEIGAISGGRLSRVRAAFPGKTDSRQKTTNAISNIPVDIPRHFFGRDDDLAAIDQALRTNNGRAAITALHGLRGVGKTTLAATYAEQHRDRYRATWWIRAETEPSLRADLVGLGAQLGWVAVDAPEAPAVESVLQQLRRDGKGVLLIYDNATNPNELGRFLPRGPGPHIIITSNAPNWRAIAAPVEIEVWPNDTGADFLVARTGRQSEREAALALSEALGGLPLAHEQAAAYCERTGVAIAEYIKRFEAAPASLLDGQDDASREYHDGLTVAKTFALAIDEAAKRHWAAEPLIVYAALLAAEPIPLFLFSEAREEFDVQFASAIADGGLDNAIAALRAFALVDRESIPDERDPAITTDCVRLHRLVRQIASAKSGTAAGSGMRIELIEAMATTYPATAHYDLITWSRARRLDAIAMALIAESGDLPKASEVATASLLGKLGTYRNGPLAAYAEARILLERALVIHEMVLGPNHPETAISLNNLGVLMQEQGDLSGARPYYERALAIREKTVGSDHPDTASALSNLGYLAQGQGDLLGARPYYERALAVREKALGSDHPDTAKSLNNLGHLLQAQGDLSGARPYYERALAVREKTLGHDHPDTATSLNNFGNLLQVQGDLSGARPYYERALAVCEKVLGPAHPNTASSLNNLGTLLQMQGDLAGALPYYERALAIREKTVGPDHLDTARSLNNVGNLLQAQGDLSGAQPYHERALAVFEKVLGPAHPNTASSLSNLGALLLAQGDLAGARPYHERALAIREKTLGPDHQDTATSLHNVGYLLKEQGDLSGARPYYERALAIREKTFGPADHPDTATSLNNLGTLLQTQGDLSGARPYYERALAICEKTLGPGHPETATSLNNLGSLLYKQGDISGAQPYFERALIIVEKKLGISHPKTRLVAQNVAKLLGELGLTEDAKVLRQKFDVEG